MKTILEQNIWGVPLGKYELFIRYANQTFYTHLEGEVYDASSLFVGKDSVAQFKKLIFEEIGSLIGSYGQSFPENVKPQLETKKSDDKTSNEAPVIAVQATEKSELEKARDAFEKFDFSNACRVLILEEPSAEIRHLNAKIRHIILQIGRLSTIAEYATYNSGRGWSFLRGSTSLGKVDGLGLTFPHEWKMPEIGKVMIHLFCPDDPRHSKDGELKDTLADAKCLADIVPWIPQALNVEAHLRALKSLNKQKDEALDKMSDDLTAMNTELSAAREALGITTPDGKTLPQTAQKGFSLLNFLLFGLPVVAFGIVGLAFPPFGGFLGSILGLFTGGLVNLLMRR